MEPSGQEPLEYQGPIKPDRRAPDPLVATLLCLPGFCCWMLLVVLPLTEYHRRQMPRAFRSLESPGLVILFWMLAVLTAVFSLAIYFRRSARPWAWYVVLNLGVNILGLLFTFGLLGVVLFLTNPAVTVGLLVTLGVTVVAVWMYSS